MSKNYTFEGVKSLRLVVKPNYKKHIEVTDGEGLAHSEVRHHILRAEWHGIGTETTGAKKHGFTFINDGPEQVNEFTPKEVHERAKELFHPVIVQKLKELYIDLINEDLEG